MYRSTFSLTSALDGGGWSMPHPGRFNPGKTWYCKGGWVGPRHGLDGDENSRQHRDSIPEPSKFLYI